MYEFYSLERTGVEIIGSIVNGQATGMAQDIIDSAKTLEGGKIDINNPEHLKQLPQIFDGRLLWVVEKPTAILTFKGGPGSGFKGHAGRPGEVGGSQEGSGHTFDILRNEYDKNNVPFDKENVSITAYRVGVVDSSAKRGIFFASDKEGAEAYASLHEGQKVKEYTIDLEKALIAGHQNSVTKLFFSKSYGDMHYYYSRKFASEVEGGRKLDAKIRNEAMKRGYKGIIYTRPAAPATGEIMIFDSNLAKETNVVLKAILKIRK